MDSMKKTMGRIKLEMTKMEKESNLLVTFSKRRAGLFKKASELCTLCGAKAAILIFSPGKKVFSFGHDSVDVVLECFLPEDPPLDPNSNQLVRVHQGGDVNELTKQISSLKCQLEKAMVRSRILDGIRERRQREFWWEGPSEELAVGQLLELKHGLEAVNATLSAYISSLSLEAANPSEGVSVNTVDANN